MILLTGSLLIFASFLMAGLLWSFRENEFLERESHRVLNDFCEVDDAWSSKGRMYTDGFAVVVENGETRFIRQSKLCGGEILV